MEKQPKSSFRENILTLLRNQKEEERLKKSAKVLENLFSLEEFRCAQTILFYASFDGEVDTFEMMKQAQKLKKTIALPTVIKAQRRIIPRIVRNLREGLHRGAYGILEPKKEFAEPVEVSQLDLVLVPGIAFDKNNHRLGRGLGYYDRFLRQLPSHTPTIGLAFDFQVVDRLPYRESHDVQLSHVVVN